MKIKLTGLDLTSLDVDVFVYTPVYHFRWTNPSAFFSDWYFPSMKSAWWPPDRKVVLWPVLFCLLRFLILHNAGFKYNRIHPALDVLFSYSFVIERCWWIILWERPTTPSANTFLLMNWKRASEPTFVLLYVCEPLDVFKCLTRKPVCKAPEGQLQLPHHGSTDSTHTHTYTRIL